MIDSSVLTEGGLVDAAPVVVRASVPVVVCRSSYGVPLGEDEKRRPPTTAAVTVREDFGARVTLYSDEASSFQVLGPRGWRCEASRGANGFLVMSIEPPGATPPSTLWSARGPADQLVFAKVPSFCCADTEVCRLIPRAQRQAEARLGMKLTDACKPPPSSEVVEWLHGSPSSTPTDRDTIVRFTDPARVAGSGDGSGGANPARGVILYRPMPEVQSASTGKLTCILPESQSDLCEVLLTAFTDSWR